MARYKVVDMSPRFLLMVLNDQPVPGSFARAVNHLVDGLHLSDFDAHHRRSCRLRGKNPEGLKGKVDVRAPSRLSLTRRGPDCGAGSDGLSLEGAGAWRSLR